MSDVSMHCLRVILSLLICSCHAQNPVHSKPRFNVDPNQTVNAYPNPRVNFDMIKILGSLVSRFYSNPPSVHEETQEETSNDTSLKEDIMAGRYSVKPVHIYGHHGGRGSKHKLSGAASGRHREPYNIVDV